MSERRTLRPGPLARQTALVLTLVSLTFAVLMWLAGRQWLIPSLEAAEYDQARSEAVRMRDVYVENAQDIARAAEDWANWDESYALVSGGASSSLREFLTRRRLGDLGVDFMVFIQRNGEFALSAEVSGRSVRFESPALRHALKPDSEFGRHLSRMMATPQAATTAGVVRLPTGPYYIVLAPVRPTHATGTPGGYLLWAVRADKILLRSKSTFFSANTRILSITSRQLPESVVRWRMLREGGSGNEVMIVPQPYLIDSWIGIRDLDGRASLMLGQSTRRDMSQLAVRYINRITFASVGGILLVGLLALYLLQTKVASRLSLLTQAVARILRPGEVEMLAVNGDDELSWLTVAINRLIDEKNRNALARDQSERRFAYVFENAVQGMLLVDAGVISEANASAARLFLRDSARALQGVALAQLVDERDPRSSALYDLIAADAAAGSAPGAACRVECGMRRADGSSFEAEVTAIRLPYGERVSLHLHVDDISQRQAALAQVQRLAFYDSLTGLVNRKLFNDRLAQMVEKNHRHKLGFALLFIDLDGFKVINDRFGHAAGDALLKLLATRMSVRVRASDTLARLGGDEFALLLEGPLAHEQVLTLAQRILEDLSTPVDMYGGIAVSASIGVLIEEGGSTRSADTVLHCADAAMYRAKRSGKNRVCEYTPGSSARSPSLG